MIKFLENSDTGFQAGYIVFTIVGALVLLGLSVLLVWSIIREHKRVLREKEVKTLNLGLMTKRAATQAIDEFIKVYRLSNEATCIIFELGNVSELIDSFGKKNEMIIKEKMMQNVVNSLPKNTILAEYKMETDSYMVVIRGMVSRERILTFADMLVDAIEKPILIPGTDIETSYTCYMGISFYPAQAITTSDLINKADVALYMNHQMSDKRFAIYTPQYDQVDQENVSYYSEVKNAIKNKEFTLYYQPIVDYSANKIVGCESLIRWEHPTLGVLPPKKFLTILENSGDIIWVGSWGISTICQTISENKELFGNDDFFFSINLSVKQLLNKSIVSDFEDICKKYNVPTSKICLEIEEYALYEKYASIREKLEDFVRRGFKIAVDQFGLDSNNILKIEQQDLFMIKVASNDYLDTKDSIIRQKMLEMMIEACKNKQTKICALRVESADAIEYMKNNGVNYYQGYFIAEPMDKEKMIEFTNKGNWKK